MSDEEREEREKKKADSDKEIGDPYKNGERNKVKDIFMGFFLLIGEILVISILIMGTFFMIFGPDPVNDPTIFFILWGIIIIIIVIVDLKFIIQFFKKDRRYIAHGMIFTILLGLIIIILMLIIVIIGELTRYPEADLMQYYQIYLIILGSIGLFLVILFPYLYLSKKYLKEQMGP